MSYSISELKTDLEGRLHGTSLNKVRNVDGVIDQAAKKLLLDLDPEISLERKKKGNLPIKEKFETLETLKKVRTLYLDLANQAKRFGAVNIISSANDFEKTQREIRKVVMKCISTQK